MNDNNDLTQYIDNTVKPVDDFYQYVNGKWIETTEIPDEYPRWGTFLILRDKSLQDVKSLFEHTSEEDNDFKKIKDFYSQGMDIEKRNQQDIEPIQYLLDRINEIKSKEDLVAYLNFSIENGESSVYSFASNIDRKNTTIEVPHLFSSGLSLPTPSIPNRDYYLNKEKEDVREKYVDYLSEIFNMIGSNDTRNRANSVLEFEKKLAEKHFTQVQKRDPKLSYNKFYLDDLIKISPSMDWKGYFKGLTDVKIDYFIIDNPEFYKLVDNLISNESIETWKNYLTARILIFNSNCLSERFENTFFNFFGKIIRGTVKIEPLWKRIISLTNNRSIIGELVGKYYVKQFFPETAKTKMILLVKELLQSMKGRIQDLDWMSNETKTKALEKLSYFGIKIGYPDVWEDYENLSINSEDTFYEIIKKCILHVRNINLSKLYKEPDLKKWFMSPQTVNAYYHPYRNEIVFPASILQFPFFDENMSWSENFGAIGTVIGHEITHGFDDKGSLFDYKGNMNNWWTEEDKNKFEEKGEYFIKQYEDFLVNGKPLNGKLTLGENIGDHGGIKVSLNALRNYLKKVGLNENDNLASDQKFFYSYARIWRYKGRKEFEELMRLSDPHSHPKARINVTLANIKEFYDCFKVKKGDKLFRDKLPILW